MNFIPNVKAATTGTPSFLLEFDTLSGLSESNIDYLKENGDAITARRLSDLLKFELLRNFQIRPMVRLRVKCREYFGEAPSDWKRRVHGSKIKLDNVGVYKSDFVLWGEMRRYKKGFYRPYIVLAGFASPTQMGVLRATGVHLDILKMLRLFVLDFDAFADSEVSFEDLKTTLNDIAKDSKTTLSRMGSTWTDEKNYHSYHFPSQEEFIQDLYQKAVQGLYQKLVQDFQKIVQIKAAGFLSSTSDRSADLVSESITA